jgi:hypothetical protein
LVFPGVFSFPWYPSVWPYWLLLGGLAIPLAGMLATLGLLLPLAVILVVLWCLGTSTVLMTVLRDTAAGNDEICNWPSAIWWDWIADAFCLFESLVLCLLGISCVAITLRLAHLLPAEPADDVFPALGGLVMFFPIVLLSLLEGGLPVSFPVWQTLFARPGAWVIFYLESLVPLAVAGVAVTELDRAWSPGPCGPGVGFLGDGGFWWTIFLAPLVFVAAGLVYFRLLGKLAWYCGQEPPESEMDEDELADEGGAPVTETPGDEAP